MTDALILAAGGSRRFGAAPKQLAELAGRPLLQHALDAALAVSELHRVVVVLGAHADAIAPVLDLGRAETVVCAAWAEGQAASLRTGLAALAAAPPRASSAPPTAAPPPANTAPPAAALPGGRGERVVVLLGDQPLITPAAIELVLAAGPGARAAYDGAPGHPAYLGPDHVARARALRGDAGLRGAPWRLVEAGHLASGLDVDTPQDLEEVRREARAVL